MARKRRAKKSRYKGVYWHKTQKRWLVELNANGKKHPVGMFDNEEDAARAYDAKAVGVCTSSIDLVLTLPSY